MLFQVVQKIGDLDHDLGLVHPAAPSNRAEDLGSKEERSDGLDGIVWGFLGVLQEVVDEERGNRGVHDHSRGGQRLSNK